MPSAIILLNVEAKDTSRIAEAMTALAGVTEVYSVAGNFDLVAILRVRDNEDLADLVTEKIRIIPGILKSQTLIAFRTFSAAEIHGVLEMS